jgi:hypothetical protein
MRVESLFNRAFGDKLNPFYHLGSLSFYLFWIVCCAACTVTRPMRWC